MAATPTSERAAAPASDAPRATPEVSVVVPAHARRVRLVWLLHSLAEQSIGPDRFEVVVVHNESDTPMEELLDAHPLTAAGSLRRVASKGPSPSTKRNLGWRGARAPLVAFTDDDCRAPEDWLENVLAAAAANPGAVVQGATLPDPDESELLIAGAHVQTQRIDPPNIWGETCNIVYPRAALEHLGGFDERYPRPAGEDTDLGLRARAAGIPYVGAPEVLTYHAVEVVSLWHRMRSSWRWQHMAQVVKSHPEMRDGCDMRVFWIESHRWLYLALAGVPLARRAPLLALLMTLPYAYWRHPQYGPTPRGRLRSLGELPSLAAVDMAELAALIVGSVRNRTILL